jgi:radical SAM protein with 4Fe4S-binding SPASM domain
MKIRETLHLASGLEKQSVSPSITQVYIELSTHCNLTCMSCIRQSIIGFRKRHFTLRLMRTLAPMLEAVNPERIVLLGFGEALCNPHIKEHLAALRALDSRIILVSNASFLTEGMSSYLVSLPLDELYVSWDDDIYGTDTKIRLGARADIFRKNVETLAGKKAASARNLPVIGMQIVATKSNYKFIAGSIEYGRSIGINRVIVSNLYPYTDSMSGETLYGKDSMKRMSLRRLLRTEMKRFPMRVASQEMHAKRNCPFMEKGTVFITADGEIAPCPELAYTHPAFYSGTQRMHNRFILGSIRDDTLENIWNYRAFKELRDTFIYYDFPDCSNCQHPDLCTIRIEKSIDCFDNQSPCGECLWARNIILCP